MSQEQRTKFKISKTPDGGIHHFYWCPGCKKIHSVRSGGQTRPMWTWNGSHIAPTFSPSVLTKSNIRCHCFIHDGKIEFLGDCEHELAGKTIDMLDWTDEFFERGD